MCFQTGRVTIGLIPQPKPKPELVVDDKDVEKVVEIICDIGKIGNMGDNRDIHPSG